MTAKEIGFVVAVAILAMLAIAGALAFLQQSLDIRVILAAGVGGSISAWLGVWATRDKR